MKTTIKTVIFCSLFFSISLYAADGIKECVVTLDVGNDETEKITDIYSETINDACMETVGDVDFKHLLRCSLDAVDIKDSGKKAKYDCDNIKSSEVYNFTKKLYGKKYPEISDDSRSKHRKTINSLVDFMYRDGTTDESSRDKIKKDILNNFMEFSTSYSCNYNNIRVKRKRRNVLVDHVIRGSARDTDAELSKRIWKRFKDESFKQKLKQVKENPRHSGKLNGGRSIKQSTCSKKSFISKPRNYSVQNAPRPTCVGKIRVKFKNDSYDINEKMVADVEKSSDFSTLQSCIDEKISENQNLVVDRVEIDGSANQFTGKNRPGKMKEGRDLNKTLAFNRAKATKMLLPKLLSGSLGEIKIEDIPVNISAKGTNGNGTSGPCPYTTQLDANGAYKRKPEFKSSESLAEFRYASVTISFKDSSAKSAEKTTGRKVNNSIICSSYEISCAQ